VLAHIQPLHLCSSVTCLGTTLHNPYKNLVCSISCTDHRQICHFINSHHSVIQKYSTESLVDDSANPVTLHHLCYSF
jgi:hypothetical protein